MFHKEGLTSYFNTKEALILVLMMDLRDKEYPEVVIDPVVKVEIIKHGFINEFGY
ncbi:hypothetical protein [Rossellomorea sp. NRS-1567]|uniref:hypothetical protein n=1 Tax=Rossellomorea sp. NRS-1567 TaxID=3233901 RepID=UPI003D28919B